MAKKKNLAVGVRFDATQRDWLDFRAKEDGLTVSQVLRKTVVRAAQEGWSFGGVNVYHPDAARKGGGA